MHNLSSIQPGRYPRNDHPPSLTSPQTPKIIRIMRSSREIRLDGRQEARAAAGHARALLTSMTCAADGHDHWIGGGAINTHRYLALCGQLVMPAALVAPPGPACSACTAALNEDHQQQRSRSLLTRMAGLATIRQGKHRRNRAPRSVHAS